MDINEVIRDTSKKKIKKMHYVIGSYHENVREFMPSRRRSSRETPSKNAIIV